MASGFVASFCIVLTNIVMATIRQVVCPPELLGRVNATMELTVFGVVPLGTRATLLLSGAVACLGVLWLLFSPVRATRDVDVAEIVGGRG